MSRRPSSLKTKTGTWRVEEMIQNGWRVINCACNHVGAEMNWTLVWWSISFLVCFYIPSFVLAGYHVPYPKSRKPQVTKCAVSHFVWVSVLTTNISLITSLRGRNLAFSFHIHNQKNHYEVEMRWITNEKISLRLHPLQSYGNYTQRLMGCYTDQVSGARL